VLFRSETDASARGFGAVLSQEVDGVLRPIAFASKTTDEYEAKYGPTELEAAAIQWAVQKFHLDIFGRKCKVYTDHHGLQYLFTSRHSNVRIQRWALKLQDYDLEIIYRPGRKSSNVDLLSRMGASADCQAVGDSCRVTENHKVQFVGFPQICNRGDQEPTTAVMAIAKDIVGLTYSEFA